MFKQFLTSKKFLTALAVLALGTLIFSFFKPVFKPKLISSVPTNNSTKFGLVNQPITFTFANPINSSEFILTSTPDAEWQLTQVGPKSLVTQHSKPLLRLTKYTLNLLWNNTLLTSFSFTTEDTQTDYELIEDIKTEVARDFPLASKLPYETTQYKVVYSAPLTLVITIKNPLLTSAKAIEDIQSWVKSQGFDPATHKFVVVAASPTPTPSSQ